MMRSYFSFLKSSTPGMSRCHELRCDAGHARQAFFGDPDWVCLIVVAIERYSDLEKKAGQSEGVNLVRREKHRERTVFMTSMSVSEGEVGRCLKSSSNLPELEVAAASHSMRSS